MCHMTKLVRSIHTTRSKKMREAQQSLFCQPALLVFLRLSRKKKSTERNKLKTSPIKSVSTKKSSLPKKLKIEPKSIGKGLYNLLYFMLMS